MRLSIYPGSPMRSKHGEGLGFQEIFIADANAEMTEADPDHLSGLVRPITVRGIIWQNMG